MMVTTLMQTTVYINLFNNIVLSPSYKKRDQKIECIHNYKYSVYSYKFKLKSFVY